MKFIGDIHADYGFYGAWAFSNEGPSIQVGDFGVGFAQAWLDDHHSDLANRGHYFIRGNHDHPDECKGLDNYLGDWGSWGDLFFVGGARSVDADKRVPGHDWWPEEELSYAQFDRVYEDYSVAKPRVMVTHDCPYAVGWELIYGASPNVTVSELGRLFDLHQPDLWVFGHYHRSFDRIIYGTRFVCLAINEVREF